MKLDHEVTLMPKREFDSLCPYCKSRAVFLVGARRAEAGSPGERPASSGGYIEEWSCAVCYRTFELY
jgi:hypothetical protein